MPLSTVSRFSFGVGHVLNDLCASMWFSYLLVYFHKVGKVFMSLVINDHILYIRIEYHVIYFHIGIEIQQCYGRLHYAHRTIS